MIRATMTALAALAAAATTASAAPAPAPAPARPYVYSGPLPGERPYQIAAIPGVIAAGAKWELVLADANALDGIIAGPDGALLVADEQSSSIRKVNAANRLVTFLPDTRGGGSLSIDSSGRMFIVQRTCTDPGLRLGPACLELTTVAQIQPEYRMLTNGFPDGRPLGRLSDIVADGKGGAYFTALGGCYHVAQDGTMHVVGEPTDMRGNGLTLSRDNRILYVTNNTNVLAFDVQPDGSTRNRRVFGEMSAAGGGDGMTIDNEGRVYATANDGIHVFAPDGRKLGLIETPRRPITLAFTGKDRKTLYISGTGAVGLDGQPYTTPEGFRNVAHTLYKLTVLTEGFKDRPK